MSAHWEQFVFGKLVQQPGGAIVPGRDHECTGRSPGFPKSLVQDAHPGRTGIGVGTSFDWHKYPWQDTPGGFVTRAIHDGERAWILGGRLRARPEEGEGRSGRRYTQAHYAAVPADSWRPTALLDLLPQLDTDPGTESDFELPRLETGAPSLDLPTGWLDTLAPIIETVMSGHGISIQDWDSSPEEQLCLLAVSLSALPASLAWRLSIGVGVVDMDGSIAIAHGMRAMQGVRIFKGQRRGHDDHDMSAGRAYVEWLRAITDGCHSTDDLIQRVATLEHFAGWNAISPERDWVEAAGEIGAALLERELLAALQRWLTAKTQRAPDVSKLHHMRPQAIAVVLSHVQSPHAAILTDMLGADWDPAWSRANEIANERHLALAALLGKHEPPSLGQLLTVAKVELPEPLVERAVGTLAPLLACEGQGRDPQGWTALIEAAGAKWIRAWLDAASARLMWLARSQPDHPSAGALHEALRATTAAALVEQLHGRQIPSDDRLAWLTAGLRGEPQGPAMLDAFLGRVWSAGNPIGATRAALCAEQQGVGSALLDTLRAPDLAGSDRLRTHANQLALAILRNPEPAPAEAIRCVLLGWSHLEAPRQEELAKVLRPRLDPASGLLLLGKAGAMAGDPSLTPVAHEAAVVELVRHPSSQATLLTLFEAQEEPAPLHRNAAELLKLLVRQEPRHWQDQPVVAALGLLYERLAPREAGTLDNRELAILGRILRALDTAPPIEPLLALTTDERGLRFGFLSLVCHSQVILTDRQLAWVLRAVTSEPEGAGGAWSRFVRRHGWGKQLGWRLIAALTEDVPPAVERLSPTERAALRRLDRVSLLQLAARGVPVPESAFTDLDRAELGQAKPGPRGIRRIAGIMRSEQGERVRRLLAVHLVASLKRRRVLRQQLESRLLGSEGMFSSFKRMLGFGDAPTEAVQVLQQLCEGRSREDIQAIIEEGWSDETPH